MVHFVQFVVQDITSNWNHVHNVLQERGLLHN